jgi:GAF domain
VELADTLIDDFDIIDFLQVLAARCVELLDVAATGIMLADQGGSLMTVAASDERARLLELFEIQNDEGPCRDCYRMGAAVANMSLDGALERWPQFTPQAVTAGFRSANALPLRLRSQVIGSLNLFHANVDGLDSAGLRVAQALADAARSASCSSAPSAAATSSRGSCRRRSPAGSSSSRPRASWPSGCRSAPTVPSWFCALPPAPATGCCRSLPARSPAAPPTPRSCCGRFQ